MALERLIIVGGGISGLVLAKELSPFYAVTILEGMDRLGGRILSIPAKEQEGVIEAGPEFIHGKLKHTIDLLDEAGIAYVAVEGKMYRSKAGRWEQPDDMIEGWDKLLSAMKKLDADMPMKEFLDKYMQGGENEEIRKQAIAYAEGYDIADVRKVSVKALYREWSNEQEDNHRIPKGYGALVHYLETQLRDAGVVIRTGAIVKQIDWEPGEVTAYITGNEKFDAERIVLTLPPSVLSKAIGTFAINISPPLDPQIKAASEIGMGYVVKFVFEFNAVFWKDDFGFVLSDEAVPTWWSQLPDPRPVLTGWAGGHRAEHMQEQSEEELIEKGLLSIAAVFGQTVDFVKAKLVAAHVFDWQKNEAILGGYSYDMPGTPDARKLLQQPVEDTIYFCGEALYDGKSPGTVEAAIIQAKQTAVALLEARIRK